MQTKYNVDYALQCDQLKQKQIETMRNKYGVDNIQQLPEFSAKARLTQTVNWNLKVKAELPIKMKKPELLPHFYINESKMTIFKLREEASVQFLSRYGHRMIQKFGKKHLSLGLVDDGILYQVIRFEAHKGKIVLEDFGTRGGYYNPNYYAKLTDAAINLFSIEEYSCKIPRGIATPEVVQSLSLELVSTGPYEVYWITEDGLKKLTRRHNIEEMRAKYDYITSDYLDLFVSK